MTTHSSSETPSHGRDTSAAFAGLVIGAIVLFCLLFSIVKMTSAHYEHAEAATAPAAAQ